MEQISQIVGIVFGASIVLIPVLGFTLRFTVTPMVEAYAKARRAAAPDSVERLERRVLELEQHIRLIEERNALHAGMPLDESSLLRLRDRS